MSMENFVDTDIINSNNKFNTKDTTRDTTKSTTQSTTKANIQANIRSTTKANIQANIKSTTKANIQSTIKSTIKSNITPETDTNSVSNTKQVPSNIEEFLEYGWDSYIVYRIHSFVLKDIINSEEDLVNDIILALIETNYISRYSPDKGSFSTYLYGFVDNFLKKKYNKENTRHGRYIVNSSSLDTSSPSSEAEFNGSVIYLDLIEVDETFDRNFDFDFLLEEVREDLKVYKANSYSVYEGEVYNRDPLTVFDLILKDYSVIEIADILGTSRQYCYYLINKIRTSPTLQRLKADYASF